MNNKTSNLTSASAPGRNGRNERSPAGAERVTNAGRNSEMFILEGQKAWVEHFADGASSATGDSSAAIVTGLEGKAASGRFGCIALSWWNKEKNRAEMRCAEVGCGDGSDGKLKANTWYTLNALGQFDEGVEVQTDV